MPRPIEFFVIHYIVSGALSVTHAAVSFVIGAVQIPAVPPELIGYLQVGALGVSILAGIASLHGWYKKNYPKRKKRS